MFECPCFCAPPTAAEMKRADRAAVLMQERQEKDIKKINEVVKFESFTVC